MQPEQYDAWYESSRGAWIGGIEYGLLHDLLETREGETLLDVGCGTGYFTRRFGEGGDVAWAAGADIDLPAVRHAAGRGGASYLVADAQRLPFPDKSFDLVASVTALCFMQDARGALAEMLRVARRRVALGLLNRHSLLWLSKGRHGGRGAYRGASWHTRCEARQLFGGQAAEKLLVRTAVVLPNGGKLARALEKPLCALLPGVGAFIAAVSDVN